MSKTEGLWANIHKKRKRIKQGSGERMRSPGDKGAPTPDQLKRAAEDTTVASIPDPKQTVQGPKKKKKTPVVLRRFSQFINKDI